MVDSHQHFWDPAALSWDAPPAPIFHRAFLPADLLPEIKAAGITHTVLVQGYPQTPGTNRWLFKVANAAEHVSGVVAWLDLLDPRGAGKALDQLQREPKFAGIRHIVNNEPDENWILRDPVVSSLGELARRGICFDMIVNPGQLRTVLDVLKQLSSLRMVIDHLGNLDFSGASPEQIRELCDLAAFPGVYCKLSGIDWAKWSPAAVRPYIRQVIDAFGWDRVLFGSDWPVCLLTSSYQRVWQASHEVLGDCTSEQRDKIFGKNALEFYTIRR